MAPPRLWLPQALRQVAARPGTPDTMRGRHLLKSCVLDELYEWNPLGGSGFGHCWKPYQTVFSSSHDLSGTWEQTNLQRTSDHFSSLGSVDSLDPPAQSCSSGRLSAAKSSSSIDHLGGPNKRDSAYGSFSTSSSTPDHTLPRAEGSSTENLLYKVGLWESSRPGGRQAQTGGDLAHGLEEKLAHLPAGPHRESKSPQQDDIPEPKLATPGRSNFGPVWYVPEKKVAPASPPPPPPPLRSDSFAVTKGHEKVPAPPFSEAATTQHMPALPRSLARAEWRAEPADLPRQLVRAGDRKQPGTGGHHADPALDGDWPSDDRVGGLPGVPSRLQASLSSCDMRFAQSHYSHQHSRQYSDERPRPSASPREPQHVSLSGGPQEPPADCFQDDGFAAVRWGGPADQKVEVGGKSRYCCTALKQLGQGSAQTSLSEDCWPSTGAGVAPKAQEGLPTHPVGPKPRYLPQQGELSDPSEREQWSSLDRGGESLSVGTEEPPRASHGDKVSPKKATDGNFQPGDDGESTKISPQKTPMLHSLTQEGRKNRSRFRQNSHLRQSLDSNSGKPLPLDTDTHVGKPMRRSDRFATTLRNEIQTRRAELQKSKSTVTLLGTEEPEEDSHDWKEQVGPATDAPSGGSSSNTYKDHLKEVQAKVLRATSFKRRDLDPNPADHCPVPPEHRPGDHGTASLFPTGPDAAPHFLEGSLNKPSSSAVGVPYVPRIRGRRRFSVEQKLKSYSEPEKMHEVGLMGNHRPRKLPDRAEDMVASFADRRKFFEETSRSAHQKLGQRQVPGGFPREKLERPRTAGQRGEGEEPRFFRRGHTVSIGDSAPSHRKLEKVVHSDVYQRLGTFAEYQASWKEQRKPLEARSSGKYHSADDIVDVRQNEQEKASYLHERSRSSPSTDHYKEGASVEPLKQAEDPEEQREHNSSVDPAEDPDSTLGTQYWGNSPGGDGDPPLQQPHDQFPSFSSAAHPREKPELQRGHCCAETLPRDYRSTEDDRPADLVPPPLAPSSPSPLPGQRGDALPTPQRQTHCMCV
ncbi:PREDICTED: protein Shroom2-like [Elephantulus edwardii]|uniref:protein Shroom2-like n=1 Tax=Elephantulus edwardii TaxID=28737 RepID=UPI0003F09780|nr:PREDICTED: protein Shroom2-like [Elephantulus edwardii]